LFTTVLKIDLVPIVGKNLKMRILPALLFLGTAFASPADVLQERSVVVPSACAQPLPVSLAYDVLDVLHAASFCSSFLEVSTVTVTSKYSCPVYDSLLN